MRNKMLDDAGRFLARNWMVWDRRLDRPVSEAWKMISTKEGLDRWWMCPVTIDPTPGGTFAHHWNDTIADMKEEEFIDFGAMRWELRADGDGAIFSFIDGFLPDAKPMGEPKSTQAEMVQPGGVGTPWAGVAAGWHCSVDRLERAATSGPDQAREPDPEAGERWRDLSEFYAVYLTHHFDRVARAEQKNSKL